MKIIYSIVSFAFFFCIHLTGRSQDDLDALLGAMDKPQKEFVRGTFKGNRVINLQSVEKAAPGTLQFLIQHRFGPVNGGPYELFGLDQATIRIGLEYGINKFLAIGAGRNSFQKNYDAYAKATILRQSKGSHSFPLSVVYFGSTALKTLKNTDTTIKNYFSSRLSFTHQMIIGTKISEKLSLEVVPTVIHKNIVETAREPNDSYAIGAGGRLKLSKRTSINAEYIYRIPPEDQTIPSYANYNNSLSIGFDIETGGHVFQFHCSNSLSMIEKGFITETIESWGNGGIHIGFNMSRDFTFKKRKK